MRVQEKKWVIANKEKLLGWVLNQMKWGGWCRIHPGSICIYQVASIDLWLFPKSWYEGLHLSEEALCTKGLVCIPVIGSASPCWPSDPKPLLYHPPPHAPDQSHVKVLSLSPATWTKLSGHCMVVTCSHKAVSRFWLLTIFWQRVHFWVFLLCLQPRWRC